MKILLVTKVKKYFEKTNDGKQILRKALSQYLPALITNAQKKKDFHLQMPLGLKIKV